MSLLNDTVGKPFEIQAPDASREGENHERVVCTGVSRHDVALKASNSLVCPFS